MRPGESQVLLTFQVDTKGGLSKKLFDIAYNRRLRAINGSWLGAWGPERVLWDFLVFKKVRAILGGQIRFLLSGGAPLSGDTQRFINICLGFVPSHCLFFSLRSTIRGFVSLLELYPNLYLTLQTNFMVTIAENFQDFD